MSSLPFLSHHLFVAAVARDERAPRQPAPDELAPVAPPDDAPAVPLEVLDAREPMPPDMARPLRSAVVWSGA